MDWRIYPGAVAPDDAIANRIRDLGMSFDGPDIQDTVKSLNAINGAKTVYSVANSLAHKPLCISGLALAPPERIMRGIAKLYDLRAATRQVNSRTVTELLPKRLIPQSEVDIMYTIAANLPYPLRRALRNRSYDPAARQMIFLLARKIDITKSKSLAFDSMSELQKLCIVLILFENIAKELREPTPLPKYLTVIDSLHLRYKRTPGAPLTFTILHDQDGKLVEGPVYKTFPDIQRD